MRRKIPSATALTAFEASARHGSYTEAARELALTQSAVCRQVGGLESFLGVKLFRRSKHGMVLTEAGIGYCRFITKQLDDLERGTLDLMTRQGRGGTLELGVVPTFGTRWLLPRLSAFGRQQPDVTVNLSSRTRPFAFEDSGIDAAIYTGDGNWPGAVTTFLMAESMVPVCSPALIADHATLGPAELARLPLLQQSTRPYAWRQWFDSVGYSINNALVGQCYELFSMSLEAARVGLGVALVPEYDLGDDVTSGRLVVPVNHSCPSDRAYYFACPEQKSEDAVTADFRAWLVEQTRPLREEPRLAEYLTYRSA